MSKPTFPQVSPTLISSPHALAAALHPKPSAALLELEASVKRPSAQHSAAAKAPNPMFTSLGEGCRRPSRGGRAKAGRVHGQRRQGFCLEKGSNGASREEMEENSEV